MRDSQAIKKVVKIDLKKVKNQVKNYQMNKEKLWKRKTQKRRKMKKVRQMIHQ
jgi:hypothetical protein